MRRIGFRTGSEISNGNQSAALAGILLQHTEPRRTRSTLPNAMGCEASWFTRVSWPSRLTLRGWTNLFRGYLWDTLHRTHDCSAADRMQRNSWVSPHAVVLVREPRAGLQLGRDRALVLVFRNGRHVELKNRRNHNTCREIPFPPANARECPSGNCCPRADKGRPTQRRAVRT